MEVEAPLEVRALVSIPNELLARALTLSLKIMSAAKPRLHGFDLRGVKILRSYLFNEVPFFLMVKYDFESDEQRLEVREARL